MEIKTLVVILNRCICQLFIITTNNMDINQNSFQFLFATTIKALFKQTAKNFEENGLMITPEQNFILKILSQEDSIQSDLADIMKKDKSAVMRHIDQLENLGLVVRVNDSIDRRKKHIVITEDGSEMLKKCEEIINQNTHKNLKDISEEDLAIFKSVLIKLKENAEK